MQKQQRIIKKQVKVVTIASANLAPKHLWICLHGYGQLAVWFARNFAHLERDDRLFVVPEGPHRFYLQGTEGRVGASWMTKEDRLKDIEDQFNYLEELTGDYAKQFPSAKVHVFGFSQGVATAMRWLSNSNLTIESLICWAGSFPPDLDYDLAEKAFANLMLLACFGDDDQYISIENAHKMVEHFGAKGISVGTKFYEGGHKIYKDLLNEVIAECEG